MRIMKLLALASFATLAFSAVGAGSASALLFLTTGLFGAKELFKVKELAFTEGQLMLTLKSPSEGVRCEAISGLGLILNSTDVAANILLTYHECKSTIGTGGSCKSAGQPSGLIKTLELAALLVTLLNGSYGLVFSSEKGAVAEFECGTTKISITGQAAGELGTKVELEKGTTKAQYVSSNADFGMPFTKDWWTLGGIAGPPKYIYKISTMLGEETVEGVQSDYFEILTTFAFKACHK